MRLTFPELWVRRDAPLALPPAAHARYPCAMRLPTYIYGLLYPALLGSFLFGALTAPFPDRYQLWAAGLMILYFAAQFGEGAIVAYQVGPDGSPRYGPAEAAIDLVEIFAMLAIMAAIGIFGASPTGLVARIFNPDSVFNHWGWMALAFAVPPLARVALSLRGQRLQRKAHDIKAHGRLTALSFAAAFGAILGYANPALGLGVISAALLTYLAIYLGWPHLGERPLHALLEWRG